MDEVTFTCNCIISYRIPIERAVNVFLKISRLRNGPYKQKECQGAETDRIGVVSPNTQRVALIQRIKDIYTARKVR